TGLDASGAYSLTLAHAPGAFVVPAGDEGGPLTNGGNHAGTIRVGALDMWSFSATQGAYIAWSAAEPDGYTGLVPRLRLIASNGTLLTATAGALVAQINISAPQTGTYTVIVGTFDTGLDASGNYALVLAHAPGTFVVPVGDEGGALTNGGNHAGAIRV